MKHRFYAAAAACVAMVIVGCEVPDNTHHYEPPKPVDRTWVKVFASLWNGQGVPEAGAYDPALPGPHKMVTILSDGTRSYYTPYGWEATQVSDTELVVCLSDEQATFKNSCKYCRMTPFCNDPEVVPLCLDSKWPFKLYAARTGQLLTQGVIDEKATSRECPSSLPSGTSRIGAGFNETMFSNALSPYVMAP